MIDHVIYDVGVDTLVKGTLVLDNTFRLRFTSRPTPVGGAVIATVTVGQLAEAALLCAQDNAATLKLQSGRLTQAVMREFRAQCAELRSAPDLDGLGVAEHADARPASRAD